MTAKEFDEAVHRLEEGDSLLVNGLVDDGVLITGQPTGLAREGLNEKDADTDEENEAEEEMSNDYVRWTAIVKKYQNRSDVMTRRACIACIINNKLSF